MLKINGRLLKKVETNKSIQRQEDANQQNINSQLFSGQKKGVGVVQFQQISNMDLDLQNSIALNSVYNLNSQLDLDVNLIDERGLVFLEDEQNRDLRRRIVQDLDFQAKHEKRDKEIDLLENINGHIVFMREMGEVEQQKKNRQIKQKRVHIRERIQMQKQLHEHRMDQIDYAFMDKGQHVGQMGRIKQTFSSEFYSENNSIVYNQGVGGEAVAKNYRSKMSNNFSLHEKANNEILNKQETFVSREKNIVNSLEDPKLRVDLLDRVLLRNFYYDDQKEFEQKIFQIIEKNDPNFKEKVYRKRKEELRNWLRTQNSKQMRLQIEQNPSNKTQNQNQPSQKNRSLSTSYYTNKSQIQQNKIINFSQKCSAIDMTQKFLEQDLSLKKQKNIEALDYLIHFDPEKETHQEKIIQKTVEEIAVRRCFFYYSNKDDAETSNKFTFISREKFLEMVQNICGEFYGKKELKQEGSRIFDKITHIKEQQIMNFYDLIEGLRRIATIYYQKKKILGQLENIPELHLIFDQFIRDTIIPIENSFLDPMEIEIKFCLQQSIIRDILDSFIAGLQHIFVYFGSLRSQKEIEYQFIHLAFQDSFEIIWRLGFFPTKISKDVIRYYYFYCISKDQGLDFKDFTTFIIIIGLLIVRKNKIQKTYTNVKQIDLVLKSIKRKSFHNNHQSNKENTQDSIKQFVMDLWNFFTDKQLLDIMNIEKRLQNLNNLNKPQ